MGTDRTEDDLIELFEERAAIMEHDAGMSRRDAEQAAYWDLRRQVGIHVAIPEHIRNLSGKFTGEEKGAKGCNGNAE